MTTIASLPPFSPYTPEEFGPQIFHFIIGIVGTVFCIVVLASTVFRKGNAPSLHLVTCMIWGDLINLSSIVVFNGMDLYYGGFSTGKVGCSIYGFLIMFSCGMALLSLLSISVERYNFIHNRVALTLRRAWIAVGFIWGNSIFFALLPFITQSYTNSLGLQSGKMICAVSWWNNHPWTIVMDAFSLLFIASPLGAMSFCYTVIISDFLKAHRNLHAVLENGTGLATTTGGAASNESGKTTTGVVAIQAQQEQKLLIMALIMTGAFMMCWTPYLIKMIVEMASTCI
ncbi:hypothetical protein HDU91_003877 [Kappamyces sp. JEL0680]|nr:hypothetical protein HDU91_003877 [Kappamyces sp. JEL0680]